MLGGDGRRRASLALADDGTPGLALFDEDDQVRLVVEMVEDEPRLVLFDGEGRVRREIR